MQAFAHVVERGKADPWSEKNDSRTFEVASARIEKKVRPHVLLIVDNPWKLQSYQVWLENMGCVVDVSRSARDSYLGWFSPKPDNTHAVRNARGQLFDCVFVELTHAKQPYIDYIDILKYIRRSDAEYSGSIGKRVCHCIIAICSPPDEPKRLLRQGYDHILRSPLILNLRAIRKLLLPAIYVNKARLHVGRATSNYRQISALLSTLLERSAELDDGMGLVPEDHTKVMQALMREVEWLKANVQRKDQTIRALEGQSEEEMANARLTIQLRLTTAELVKYKAMYENRVESHARVAKELVARDKRPDPQLDELSKQNESLAEEAQRLSDEVRALAEANEYLEERLEDHCWASAPTSPKERLAMLVHEMVQTEESGPRRVMRIMPPMWRLPAKTQGAGAATEGDGAGAADGEVSPNAAKGVTGIRVQPASIAAASSPRGTWHSTSPRAGAHARPYGLQDTAMLQVPEKVASGSFNSPLAAVELSPLTNSFAVSEANTVGSAGLAAPAPAAGAAVADAHAGGPSAVGGGHGEGPAAGGGLAASAAPGASGGSAGGAGPAGAHAAGGVQPATGGAPTGGCAAVATGPPAAGAPHAGGGAPAAGAAAAQPVAGGAGGAGGAPSAAAFGQDASTGAAWPTGLEEPPALQTARLLAHYATEFADVLFERSREDADLSPPDWCLTLFEDMQAMNDNLQVVTQAWFVGSSLPVVSAVQASAARIRSMSTARSDAGDEPAKRSKRALSRAGQGKSGRNPIDKLRALLKDREKDAGDLRQEIRDLQEELRKAEEALAPLQQRAAALQDELDKAQTDTARAQKLWRGAQQEAERLDLRVAELQESALAMRVSALEDRVLELDKDAREATFALNQKAKELDLLRECRNAESSELSRIQQEVGGASEHVAELEEQLGAARDTLTKLQDRVDALEQRLAPLDPGSELAADIMQLTPDVVEHPEVFPDFSALGTYNLCDWAYDQADQLWGCLPDKTELLARPAAAEALAARVVTWLGAQMVALQAAAGRPPGSTAGSTIGTAGYRPAGSTLGYALDGTPQGAPHAAGCSSPLGATLSSNRARSTAGGSRRSARSAAGSTQCSEGRTGNGDGSGGSSQESGRGAPPAGSVLRSPPRSRHSRSYLSSAGGARGTGSAASDSWTASDSGGGSETEAADDPSGAGESELARSGRRRKRRPKGKRKSGASRRPTQRLSRSKRSSRAPDAPEEGGDLPEEGGDLPGDPATVAEADDDDEAASRAPAGAPAPGVGAGVGGASGASGAVLQGAVLQGALALHRALESLASAACKCLSLPLPAAQEPQLEGVNAVPDMLNADAKRAAELASTIAALPPRKAAAPAASGTSSAIGWFRKVGLRDELHGVGADAAAAARLPEPGGGTRAGTTMSKIASAAMVQKEMAKLFSQARERLRQRDGLTQPRDPQSPAEPLDTFEGIGGKALVTKAAGPTAAARLEKVMQAARQGPAPDADLSGLRLGGQNLQGAGAQRKRGRAGFGDLRPLNRDQAALDRGALVRDLCIGGGQSGSPRGLGDALGRPLGSRALIAAAMAAGSAVKTPTDDAPAFLVGSPANKLGKTTPEPRSLPAAPPPEAAAAAAADAADAVDVADATAKSAPEQRQVGQKGKASSAFPGALKQAQGNSRWTRARRPGR